MTTTKPATGKSPANTGAAPQAPHMEPVKALRPEQGIKSVQDLADHLYVAAQVELSTIPPYLFAAYSLRTSGHSQWSVPLGALRTLLGISIEEMLHLALVRNLMVAIGHGNDIKFYDEKFIPTYPSKMMHRYNPDDPDGAEVTLTLDRLSKAQAKLFSRIEMPDKIDSAADVHTAHPEKPGQYTSLGAFYRSVEDGFKGLHSKIKWDTASARKQYKRAFWNQYGHGKPIRVHDLDSALAALEIIIEQGEGTVGEHKRYPVTPGIEEYTHYEKFLRIHQGVEGIGAVNGEKKNEIDIDDSKAAWPVVTNPNVDDFKDQPGIHALMTLFNAAYCYTLCLMDELYQHSTDDVRMQEVDPHTHRKERFSRRYGLERNGIALMQGILYPLAATLMSTPIPGGKHEGKHAAPSFQYYAFTSGSKKKQLDKLFDEALKHYPVLGGPDGVQRQLHLLTEI
jgi:ferritin-like protein